MITLRHTIGIVFLLAVIMACVAATLRPPGWTTTLPSGLLFALTISLCAIAFARIVAALPQIDRFWMGFLLACLTCFVVSFSTPIVAANTAPEHVTRFLVRLRPLEEGVSVHQSNDRFYAMQRIVTNSGVLILAVTCGLLAQRRSGR